jgi:hypothetical protein
MDLQPAVVFDRSKPSELVHEDVDATSICADDFRKCLLRDFRNAFLRSSLFAIERAVHAISGKTCDDIATDQSEGNDVGKEEAATIGLGYRPHESRPNYQITIVATY